MRREARLWHWGPALVFTLSLASAPLLVEARPGSPSDGRPVTEEVSQTFLADCAVCHGADAQGTDRGPSLVGVGAAAVDFQLSTGRMPLAVASRTEEAGRPVRPAPRRTPASPGAAPGRHRPAYPPEVRDALVAYVAGLTGSGGPPIPAVTAGDVAAGGEQYRLNCAACHSWAGTGGALVRREAPDLQSSTAVQTAEAIRIGPGRMPAFGAASLSDEEVSDVVAYVQEIQEPEDRGGLALAHLGPVAEGAAAGVALAALLLSLRWIGQRG